MSALRGKAGEEESTFRCYVDAFLIALIAVGGRGHLHPIVADVLMVAIMVVILVEFMRPQLQVRRPLPKPEITLNITDSSN